MAFAMLFALSLAFLFVAYCMARALIGGFGANFATIALSRGDRRIVDLLVVAHAIG